MHMKEGKDNLSKSWFILSNALPPIGFFLRLKYFKIILYNG